MDDNTLYLAHHGVLGQKWGVRRYQNPDGSLTNAGAKRYAKIETKYNKRLAKSKSFDDQISVKRKANRAKLENKIKVLKTKRELEKGDTAKLDKKIAKKTDKLKDFDDYTKSVNAGTAKYNRIISDYKDAKLKSITDKDYTKTPQYKKVVNAYTNQRLTDIYYGHQVYSKLFYANDDYRARH